jgi:hypothetical protein
MYQFFDNILSMEASVTESDVLDTEEKRVRASIVYMYTIKLPGTSRTYPSADAPASTRKHVQPFQPKRHHYSAISMPLAYDHQPRSSSVKHSSRHWPETYQYKLNSTYGPRCPSSSHKLPTRLLSFFVVCSREWRLHYVYQLPARRIEDVR